MYEIFEHLLQIKGVSTYKVAKETGIPQQTFSKWKKGISTPKADKIQKIADKIILNSMIFLMRCTMNRKN